MKALATTLGVLILSVFFFNDSMAQKASYTTYDGWTMGVGGGYAYQKSDIANSQGFGFDFILGRQLYYKENAFLSVDLKFRFLGGRNMAYDHRMNPDGSYSNIRYKFFTYDLELGLTLNRLRERTGIILTGFAGAGLTHGRTYTDLYDAGDNLYDFGSIDPYSDKKVIYNDLVALSDGDFETSLVNKVAILPTAGIYLGYQLSRSLTLGVEYKTNFYLTEENGLFGIDLDNKANSGSGIDRNNYVSLGIRWNLRGGSSHRGGSTNYSNEVNNTYSNNTETYTPVVQRSLPLPSVRITEPSSDPYHTLSSNQTIRATIDNVSGAENISFFQNGFPVNIFTYNASTKTFVANVRLREGENNFRIQASNQASFAEDFADIILDKAPKSAVPAPLLSFTSPSENPYITSADGVDVTARVQHINSKENIQLTLNGVNTPFEYLAYSGLVKTTVMRNEEINNLHIEAFNESGSAQDQLTVRFTEPEKVAPPAVHFTDPPYPIEVNNQYFPLRAETQNVLSRNDIELTINGALIGNFSYNADGMAYVNLLLSEGVNIIEITARNEAGMASDRTSITYLPPIIQEPVYVEPAVRIYPPVIHIIRPLGYPFRTYEQSGDVLATVLNVHSKENILVNINGYSTRDFNYNPGTKELYARISLRDGENVLSIHAQNESGGDAKEVLFIKETRHCPPPVVNLIDPTGRQVSTSQQSYALRAEARNITNTNQLRLLVNGKTVSFTYRNNLLTSSIPLGEGLNSISLNAVNECGQGNASARINYEPSVIVEPCPPPTVAFSLQEVMRGDATHELMGSVTGIRNKSDISLTLDGNANSGFQFVPSTGKLSAKFKLSPGSHVVVVSVNNDCGTDNQGASVTVEEPCTPPTVAFSLQEVISENATHELMGSISGVRNKTEINLTIDGKANNRFQFVPSSGELRTKLKLTPGPHTLVLSANNSCGADYKTQTLTFVIVDDDGDEDDDGDDEENEDCGIRINPGNSDWQFCLVTPSGTYNRESLTNSNFSYSGPASSLYIKPIGGGGEATVNGQAYAIRSGQYYLFSGSLDVSVSTNHPGAMGHWSVCISSSSAPVSGNGNNRPESPCEQVDDESEKGNSNNGNSNSKNDKGNNGSNDNANNGSTKSASTGSDNVSNNRTSRTGDRTNTRTNNATNTRTPYRTNDKTINRTNTRTNTIYRTDDRTKKSTNDRSIDSSSNKTKSTTRTNNRSGERTPGRNSSRTER